MALNDLHLKDCIHEARCWCAGCSQVRGDEATHATCGGCKVGRSILHLLITSETLNQITYLTLHTTLILVSVCGCALHEHCSWHHHTTGFVPRTSEDGVKQECENGQRVAQGCVWATAEMVFKGCTAFQGWHLMIQLVYNWSVTAISPHSLDFDF